MITYNQKEVQKKKSQTKLEKKYIKTSVLMVVLMSFAVAVWIVGAPVLLSLIPKEPISSIILVIGTILMFVTELWIFFFFMKVLDNLESKLEEIQNLGSDKE